MHENTNGFSVGIFFGIVCSYGFMTKGALQIGGVRHRRDYFLQSCLVFGVCIKKGYFHIVLFLIFASKI
jgi:hypothetical protein